MNIVTIAGTIGRDAELKMTTGGAAMARVSVVTNYRYVKDGQKVEEAEWHRCTIWGKRAEGIAPHLLKGGKVAISGRLKTTNYTDNAGVKKYSTEIVVNDISLLGGGGMPKDVGGGGGGYTHPKDNSYSAPPAVPGQDDDIPF